MKYKKILFLFLISGLVFSGCGKKDVQEEVSTEMVIDVPSYQVTATPVPTRTAAPTEKPLEVKKDGTLEELQNIELENKYLNEFMNELLTLQEKHLLDVYNQVSVGDSHKKVMEAMAVAGLRYDEEVRMVTCYDDAKNVLNMEDRTGIVAFDKMDLTLAEETEFLTSTETSKYYLDKMQETEKNEDSEIVEDVETITEDENISSLNLEESELTEETETVETSEEKIKNPNVPEGAVIVSEEADGSVVIEKMEEPEEVYSSLDVSSPVYHSYIAFTFNELNVLVGKFKYFDRLEWFPKEVNEEIINGSLNGKVKGIELKISMNADAMTIYEKMDEIRTRIESNKAEMDALRTKYIPTFEEFYGNINEESHMKTVLEDIEIKGFNIEKMNKTILEELNKRFQRNYTEGYYVSLTVDEEEISPDLRYNDTYITLLFSDKNMMYYKAFRTPETMKEECKDILDINDYELNDIYESIKTLTAELIEFESERTYFTDYIDKNIALFNSKIELSETKDFVLSELEKAGLKYEENYDNLTITSYRDAANLSVKAFKENGEENYDECMVIYGGSKDIYLFFKEGVTCGIHRTEYFDISEVVTSSYSNLKTVFNGLENIDSKIQTKKQELVQYTNMLDTRLDSFKNNLGYSTNHKEGQIYTKTDVLKALELGGYAFEEGMNKGDGLYFIGVKRMHADEDFALKIYFNTDEEIETIKY